MNHPALEEEPALTAPPLLERQSVHRALIAVIVLGIVARIMLLLVSRGTHDIVTWERLASQINRIGLYDTYRHEGTMNHPPLAGYGAAAALSIARQTGIPFPQIFKSVTVLADVAALFLIMKIWRERRTRTIALLAGALYAWNPDAILISAHHGNTDNLYTFLALLAVWFVQSKQRAFLAGLALGAAMNVKLLPAVLLVPMLMLSRTRRELMLMIAGLSIASIPFIYCALDLGFRFRQRVIQYQPAPGGWGLYDWMDLFAGRSQQPGYFRTIADRFAVRGSLIILSSIALAMLVLRRRGELDRYRAAAVAVALFAVVTQAMGIQYTPFIGAMLFAFDLRMGAIWGLLTGSWLLLDYYTGWDGALPIFTLRFGPPTVVMKILMTLSWAWAICCAASLLRRHRDEKSTASPPVPCERLRGANP